MPRAIERMLLTHITNGINGCSLNVHTQAGMREEKLHGLDFS
jgi:hypothetical protein